MSQHLLGLEYQSIREQELEYSQFDGLASASGGFIRTVHFQREQNQLARIPQPVKTPAVNGDTVR
jgi:hypothetical protein